MNSSSPSQILSGALALHRMGNLRAAMDGYMKVLNGDPQNADALYYVAVVAVQEGQYAEGIKLAERALSFGPQQAARVHNLMGQSYVRLGQPEQALASYDRAIALQPDFADAHGNRATVLGALGRLDESLAGYDRALSLRPGSFEDWTNRGALLQDLDRIEEALASYERAIALQPEFAGAHYNRGNALRELAQLAVASGGSDAGQFDAAEAAYGKAIELDPKLADAYLGRALLRLMRGNWEAGWRDYEYRASVGKPTFMPLNHPRWQGEPPADTRLVLVSEQGLGDAMFFGRFGSLLAGRGYDVTILTRPSMRTLLSSLAGVKIATSPEELAQDPRPIRWLPLMSVAGALGITPATVPADVPYLSAQPERIAAWAQRLGSVGFKIGINWTAGHQTDHNSIRRSIPLSAFAPLAALPGVRLISLQKGPATDQIMDADFRNRILVLDTDPNPEADLFLDTAALMTQLDLVVTCDTSVPHLAGALARPTFTALPVGRLTGAGNSIANDSPWYPTMRLFRQGANATIGPMCFAGSRRPSAS